MADRKERRFIQKERMRKAGLTQICSKKNYDSVNETYRSFFAMHWRNYPNLDIVPILKKKESPHTKRNLNVKRRSEARGYYGLKAN